LIFSSRYFGNLTICPRWSGWGKGKDVGGGRGGGGKGTHSIHDWGSNVIFWVQNIHPLYFFGSRNLSCFLGLEKSIFFGFTQLEAKFLL